MNMKHSGVSTSVQLLSVVVAFLIGLGVMYAAAPSVIGAKTTTITSTSTAVSTITSTANAVPSSSTLTSTTTQASSSSATGQPINIGCLTSLTGSFAPNGNEAHQAAQLAADQINANGGVDGRPINLITLDDQTNPTQGLTDATQLVNTNNVLAITCLDSSAVADAVNGYTQQNGIPIVDPIAADPTLTSPSNNWTVRLVSDSVSIGAIYAKYVTDLHPNARIAIVATQIVYFEQVAEGFAWYVQNESHASIVYNKIFPASQSDYGTVVAGIKASNATIIFEDLATGVTSFYTSVLQAGYNQSQFFITQDEPANVIPLGTSGAGVTAGSNYNIALANSSNGVAAFNQNMEQALNSCSACGKTPSLDSYFSYVAVQIIALAAKNAMANGTLTRQSLMTAIKNISYKDSVLGITWKFNQFGAAPSWNYMVEITNVNPAAGNWTDKILTYIQFPPGFVPSYQIATGS